MYDATPKPKKRKLEEPTSYLRWSMSKPIFDYGYPLEIPRLQQKWKIQEYGEMFGKPLRVYYEWRDIEMRTDPVDPEPDVNELDAAINRAIVTETTKGG